MCVSLRGKHWPMPALPIGNTLYTHSVAKVMISIPDDLLERLDAHASLVR